MSRPNLPDCLCLRHVVVLPEAAAATERLAAADVACRYVGKMETTFGAIQLLNQQIACAVPSPRQTAAKQDGKSASWRWQ